LVKERCCRGYRFMFLCHNHISSGVYWGLAGGVDRDLVRVGLPRPGLK
jgi:hypothetical protein